MRRFGLIGFPLGHSFSKAYFAKKFEEQKLENCRYDLFELENIELFPQLWEQMPELVGVNVTVPYKEKVKVYLNRLDASAEKVGAVNVIKKVGDELVGYNSDFFGFYKSLATFISGGSVKSALVLGSGGAAKAVEAALKDLGITYQLVSRQPFVGRMTYDQLKTDSSIVRKAQLIVNTTPLGMQPKLDGKPDLPYEVIGQEQYFYDLVYNPEETAFMKEGIRAGAKAKNGLEMLHLQADKAWEIWNS